MGVPILRDSTVEMRSKEMAKVLEDNCFECNETGSQLSGVSKELVVAVLITCPQNIELFKTFRQAGLDCEFGCPLSM